jgi:hypothetical protein
MLDKPDSKAHVPLVTVAIPTFNRASFLPGALTSALNQTFRDFELLVIDDCSSDSTQSIVHSFGDCRIKYVRNATNLGMTANWNKSFDIASGQLVSLLHDDDRWSPTFLERTVALFRENPEIAYVYARTQAIKEDGVVLGRGKLGLPKKDCVMSAAEAVDRMVRRCEVSCDCVLVRRGALAAIGGFRDRWPFPMDWEAWIKMAARFPVGFVSEILGRHSEHAGQLSEYYQQTPLAIGKEWYGMLRETISELPLSKARRDHLMKAAMVALAQTQIVTGWDFAVGGDGRRARTEGRFAFAIDSKVAWRAPLLVTAMFTGSFLPASILRQLDRFRGLARPLFRRDL